MITVHHTSPATRRLPCVVAATNATNQNATSGLHPDLHHASAEMAVTFKATSDQLTNHAQAMGQTAHSVHHEHSPVENEQNHYA